ncbi:2-phospho-L-lactate guanylyltransferase [Lacisediminihabitans changchengi]|uniref:2-phospho-L-lactate guanylyltransferase n=1 Tax=Lacisediminihabitans changchengi TaxID=2787634 RepID=A0A934VWW2_9MICO|nr:2-phospho-L-lactate guanylyltransferase [Lacisediminihabitans changchengi]MBK4346232.1 2-phospho-L-lactate guanylyltransferase [Lacisediminihabitans changchengi]
MVKAYRADRLPTTTGIRKAGKTIPDTHEPQPTTEWVVVIPVKGTPDAKSRFGDTDNDGNRAALALAIAYDTVQAAVATAAVSGVLVVTSAEASVIFDETDALVLVEEEPDGLAAAIALGVETAEAMGAPGRGVAVLLGDLPAMTPAELDAALVAAAAHDRAMVTDAAGTGTTLITAADGASHAPAFGVGSAEAHRAVGYVALEIAEDSGLRRDVDTREELQALVGRLGPRTSSLVE